MKFSRTELLNRLNAPSASKNRSIRWQYNDAEDTKKHGFAQIRFEHGERFLVAEASQWGKPVDMYKFDGGELEDLSRLNAPETFELRAFRNWMTDEYEIVSLTVDGESYPINNPGMIELALCIFMSRSDEIETLGKKSNALETSDQPKQVYSREETIRRNMPTILFGDHFLAFNGECHIQGVA